MSRPVELPRWMDVALLPLVNLAMALVVCAIVVAVVGLDPLQVITLLAKGAFGSKAGISYTLYYATTFVFTGLAVAVAFHAGLFNIGGEGQAVLGGLGAWRRCRAHPAGQPTAAAGGRCRLRRGLGAVPGAEPAATSSSHHHVQLHRLGAAGLPAGERAEGAGQHDGGDRALP
jgi:hypothetical protein